jgi:hypothetical protein
VTTSRQNELLQQGPRAAPEPLTAEERSLTSAGGAAVGGLAIAAAVVKWALGTAVIDAVGKWVVVALGVFLAALIVGDAAHRVVVAVRGRQR